MSATCTRTAKPAGIRNGSASWPSRASARLAALASRFARDRSGAVAMIYGLMLIPMAAMIGLAVDFGRVYSVNSSTQGALDAAALAAGRAAQVEPNDTINKASAAATAYFVPAATSSLDAPRGRSARSPARPVGSQSATSRGSVGDLVRRRRTAGSRRRDAGARGARRAGRRTTIRCASRTRARAPNRRPARLARATASASSLTSVAHTSASGSSAASAERERARAGAEVGDRVRGDAAAPTGRCGPAARRAAPPRRSRSARPPRSRGAGRAPAGRRAGRARGTASARARTAAARRRRGGRACRRGAAIAGAVAGSCSPITSSTPS